MSRTSKLLTEEVVGLAKVSLADYGKSGMVAIKLRAVISAHKYGITTVAKVFDITKATLISWIKHVKNDSINRLKVQPGRGRRRMLSDIQEEIVTQWLEGDSQITINKLRAKVLTEMSVELSRATVHRMMQKLKFSYVTPRPKHYKQDPISTMEVKKKSDRSN